MNAKDSPKRIWVTFAETSLASNPLHIRMWQQEPFVGAAEYVQVEEAAIDRFDSAAIMWSLDGAPLKPSPDGMWVRFADVQRLAQEKRDHRRSCASAAEARAKELEGRPRLDKIWIVGGTVGEWSDRSEWTVGAWESEADAKAFVEQISALGRVFEQAANHRFDSDHSEAAVERAKAACKALDAGWSDYCGEAPHYTCWEETLRRVSGGKP